MMEKMDYTFARLKKRVMEAVDDTDMSALFGQFRSVQGPTLICGCGGSAVVAAYLEKVLSVKNGIPCRTVSTRDVQKMHKTGWNNVIAISYSGDNPGVRMALDNSLNRYLFSVNEKAGVRPLRYGVSEREESYVSLSATFVPMAAALLYYTDGDRALLEDILDSVFDFGGLCPETDICEIITGEESSAAAALLESTMTEAGLCAPVIHDKYNLCHGRINLNRRYPAALIHFDDGSELDRLIEEELHPEYRSCQVMKRRYEDVVVNDMFLCWESMNFCRELALLKGIDLASIDEWEKNDLFYRYDGEV